MNECIKDFTSKKTTVKSKYINIINVFSKNQIHCKYELGKRIINNIVMNNSKSSSNNKQQTTCLITQTNPMQFIIFYIMSYFVLVKKILEND